MIPSCTALNIFHPKTPLPHRRVEREGVTPQEWIVMLRIGYRMPLGLTMRPADTILSDLHRMTQLRPLTCYLFSWQQPREGSLLTRPERPEKKNPITAGFQVAVTESTQKSSTLPKPMRNGVHTVYFTPSQSDLSFSQACKA